MIHGLSPPQGTQAHSLRPDYPVCWDRIIRSDDGGRIIRAGLLEKSGHRIFVRGAEIPALERAEIPALTKFPAWNFQAI